jgi:hypothetical protein
MGMLEQVLTHIHNFFPYKSEYGPRVRISDGTLITAMEIPEGVWYRIEGSLLNDGLHRHPAPDLVDETFDGTVTLCAIPNALLEVVDEIEQWCELTSEARQKALGSPYQSESFDGYSYSLRGDIVPNTASGGLTGWQAEFASRLNAWRKIS